jgi:hypothetical protein
MSISANVPAQGQMTSLVESIREVQKMQAQVRAQLSELEAADNRAPIISGLPTGQCLNWTQTTQCMGDGPIQMVNDIPLTRSCTTPLESGWSGYCVCGTGSGQVKIGFNCGGGQNGRTCAEVCDQTGASAYAETPATGAAECLQTGGVFMGQATAAGFAAGSPGSYFPGCPSGAACCTPLTGTINVSDAAEIIVEGAAGVASKANGVYVVKSGSGGVVFTQDTGYQLELTSSGWSIMAPNGTTNNVYPIVATGPYAKDPLRIPVGGGIDHWQAATASNNADVSGIRLSAPSRADLAANAKKRTELLTQLTDLERVENTLLDDLRSQRLAATSATGAEQLALKAEAKAAKLLEEESAQQRRRLARERGQAAKDTTLITAARSTSLRAQAYTRLTLVAITVLVAAFIIYRLRIMELIDGDISFVLSVAAGAAALIVGTIMLNNIQSRNPRDFSKFYFAPPAGPSALTAAAFSSANADGQSLQSCQRAL